MTMPVILSPAADREFEAATVWYEQEAALGAEFVDRVQDALDRIGQIPESHAVIDQGIRRARVPRFPYSLYYRIQGDRVEVIALLHNHRNPSVWRSRA